MASNKPAANIAALTDAYRRYVNDFESFARDCLVIRDHNTQKLLPFVFNRGQRILHACLEKQKAEKGAVRALLLKSRRFGGSTYTEGRFYWLTSTRFNRNTFIVGHELSSTDELYSMAKLFHERNPFPPATRKSNSKELIFDTDNGRGLKSEYTLACARNLDAGRSQGIHYLHGSECAYWPDAEALSTSLLSCVPDPPTDSEVIFESTANGYGNRFQADVFRAYCEGRHPFYVENGIPYAWHNPGISDWILVFIPWFVHERYTRPFESEAERNAFEVELRRRVLNKETMTWEDSEALRLMRRYNLTLEQLHWRAWAIENKCNGRIEVFRQEYPATVEEAFLSRGSNVFGRLLCDTLEAACKDPILVGDPVVRNGVTRIRPNPAGHLKIWEKPRRDQTYVLTVDSAGGIKPSHEEKQTEPDPTCIDVWNHRTGVQAAQWHGHVDYGVIAELVEMIGALYYRAPACVELQNHGYTVVRDLERVNYPMYEHKPGEPGWSTNKKTKPVMVDRLHELASTGQLQIRCRETVSEMRTFVEKGGKLGAELGCHDERVDTAAMAAMMMTSMARQLSPQEEEKFKPAQRQGVSLAGWQLPEGLPPGGTGKEVGIGGWLSRRRAEDAAHRDLEITIGR